MNGMGEPSRKKIDPTNQKNIQKIKVKLQHVNKKTTSQKANFCSNTVFSLYFKIRANKLHATKPVVFLLQFLFRRDQNHYSNLTSKNMKIFAEILKKTAPKCISNYLNYKKHSRTRPEIKSKHSKQKLKTTVPDQQIILTTPANNKSWETKTKQINQKQLLLKLWKLLPWRPTLIQLNILNNSSTSLERRLLATKDRELEKSEKFFNQNEDYKIWLI